MDELQTRRELDARVGQLRERGKTRAQEVIDSSSRRILNHIETHGLNPEQTVIVHMLAGLHHT